MRKGFKFEITITENVLKKFFARLPHEYSQQMKTVESTLFTKHISKTLALTGMCFCGYLVVSEPPFSVGQIIVASSFGYLTGFLIGRNWILIPWLAGGYVMYTLMTYEFGKKKKD